MSKRQTFDFSVNVLRAILWQYDSSPNLVSLLTKKEAWYEENQRLFWENWVRDVFDLRTANDFGCAVWAIILGVPLAVVLEPDYLDKPVWGFGQYRKNFNRGNFATSTQTVIPLTIEQKRLVLQLRYFQLISRGTIPQTNHFMRMAFEPWGLVYALDPLDMGDIVYVFTFAPPRALTFVLRNYDILPRPAGCGVHYVITVRDTWGFGQYHRNFNRGTFQGDI